MEDGFGPEEAGGQIGRRVWMRRLALRHATVLLPSRRLYGIARNIWRLPERRLIYVPNGVDCERFSVPRSSELADRLGLTPGIPVVGTVSGLRREKNIGRLVDAFAHVARQRPAQLVVVGDGPEREALAAQAAALKIAGRVIFAGPQSKPEQILPLFDVFGLSSDTEQMPLSVLEAMAAGLPLGATDVGDVRTMLAPENHPFLVGTDATELGGAILALLADKPRAAAIGAANAARVRAVFDQSLMFSAYENLFEGKDLRSAPGSAVSRTLDVANAGAGPFR